MLSDIDKKIKSGAINGGREKMILLCRDEAILSLGTTKNIILNLI